MNKFTFFLDYIPRKYRDITPLQAASRQLVLAFKDGLQTKVIANYVANELKKTYGEQCKEIVFTCIPASTKEKHETNEREEQKIKFTKSFFKAKKVVCFDDVITEGKSFNNFAEQIKSLGADVLQGIFLAQTKLMKNEK